MAKGKTLLLPIITMDKWLAYLRYIHFSSLKYSFGSVCSI
ncbi:hypothetical protein GARC_0901 [Paraglaciecola arctica BSs20135]|uniref:Uncharacterized protein n=1 Tax=Paraglaciecola arctica BSs20135 TaxID=493475 RepID=K6YI91_9ALTE|nr:hypothetical protein GARC_0901 [Paraglaciecola arctica BSs20135]